MAAKINSGYDVNKVRKDFPVLTREIRPGVPLTYLDSAATSQKPNSVIQAMTAYYQDTNANIHQIGIKKINRKRVYKQIRLTSIIET